jgi:hypothetical protein
MGLSIAIQRFSVLETRRTSRSVNRSRAQTAHRPREAFRNGRSRTPGPSLERSQLRQATEPFLSTLPVELRNSHVSRDSPRVTLRETQTAPGV